MADGYSLWITPLAELCTIIMTDNDHNLCEIVKYCVNYYYYFGIEALAQEGLECHSPDIPLPSSGENKLHQYLT